MFKTIISFLLFCIAIAVLVSTCNTCTYFASDANQVVRQEFAPTQLLKKYEEFKDISAAIDKKRADIEMYQAEIKTLPNADKDDKYYLQQRKSELLGIIAMHNQLCAEYNSAMSKFNYRFTNVGDLPASNLEPLPREIKPYINSLTN